jgi:thioredoxin reductase
MKIDTRRIQKFAMGTENSGIVIHFEDGSQVQEGFLAHAPQTKVRGPFVGQLGIERGPNGDIKVNTPFCQTSIPGVFAVGDNSAMLKSVPNAIFTGTLAGTGAASQIMAEQLGQKPLFP